MTSSQPISLKQKLEAGQTVYGTSLIAQSPLWFNALKGAGLDFVFLDTEHIPVNRKELAHACHHLSALGITPVVRISNPDPFLACQAIDAGAKGIVAPYIETTAQLRALTGAVKYRPLKGRKLEEVLAGETTLPVEIESYLDSYNNGNLLIANVESVAAADNLDFLLQEPGLDGVFVGPHDLSVSLEVPEQYDDPVFQHTITTIIRKTRAAGKHVGVQWWLDPKDQIRWGNEGMNIVIHSNDLTLFRQTLERELGSIRQRLTETS